MMVSASQSGFSVTFLIVYTLLVMLIDFFLISLEDRKGGGQKG
jgi:hypothetical protein